MRLIGRKMNNKICTITITIKNNSKGYVKAKIKDKDMIEHSISWHKEIIEKQNDLWKDSYMFI